MAEDVGLSCFLMDDSTNSAVKACARLNMAVDVLLGVHPSNLFYGCYSCMPFVVLMLSLFS